MMNASTMQNATQGNAIHAPKRSIAELASPARPSIASAKATRQVNLGFRSMKRKIMAHYATRRGGGNAG